MAAKRSFVPPSQKHTEQPIDKVRPHPRNPNNGDVEAIKASIQELGQYKPILAQLGTGFVLVGNHTYAALMELGATHVGVEWAECDDETAVAIMLADNHIPRKARPDEGQLAELLKEFEATGKLVRTSYSPDDLEDLIARLGRIERAPMQPFMGDYAPPDPQVAARLNEDVATPTRRDHDNPLATGLKEVVLVYPVDDYEQFMSAVKALRDGQMGGSTSECVLAALRVATA